jgi:hypothetical protein
MAKADPNAVTPGLERLWQYGMNLGGALLRDHVWVMGSLGIQNIHARSEGNAVNESRALASHLKAHFSWGPFRGGYAMEFNDWSRSGEPSLSAIQQAPASLWERRSLTPVNHLAHLAFERADWQLEFKAAHGAGGYQLKPAGNTPKHPQGGLEGQDYWYYFAPQAYLAGGNVWESYDRAFDDLELDGHLWITGWLGGDHELRLGGELWAARSQTQQAWPYQRRLFRSADRFVLNPDLWNALRQELGSQWDTYIPQGWTGNTMQAMLDSRSDSFLRRLAFYLQDTARWGHLSVGLGVRFDRQSGEMAEVTLPGFTLNGATLPAWAPFLGEKQISGFDSPVVWATWSPRLSITYDMGGDGRTVAAIAVSRYGSVGGN